MILAAFGLACSSGGKAPPSDSEAVGAGPGGTRTSEEGSVTVQVTWNGSLNDFVFEVVMDTHSVDLDSFDLSQLAVLRSDRASEVRPAGWDAPKGGHHRSGQLRFPGSSLAGQPRYVELVVRGLAAPERVFRWEIAAGGGG